MGLKISSPIAYNITCDKNSKYKHRLSKVVHDSVHHLERGKCNAKVERRRFLRMQSNNVRKLFKILEVSDNDRKFLSRFSAKMSDNDLAKVKKITQ